MSEQRFELSGGALCLDLANTLGGRSQSELRERLGTYDDLVAWGRQADVLGETEARRLLALAAERPDQAQAALACAREVREAIYRTFTAAIAGSPADPDDIARLNRVLGEGMARRRITPSANGYCWAWADEPDGLDWIVWPAAYSAAELLTSDRLDRVRQCGADDCDWLFLDTSRNRSRRWCDMSVCGNREKARRHYARARGRRTGAGGGGR